MLRGLFYLWFLGSCLCLYKALFAVFFKASCIEFIDSQSRLSSHAMIDSNRQPTAPPLLRPDSRTCFGKDGSCRGELGFSQS